MSAATLERPGQTTVERLVGADVIAEHLDIKRSTVMEFSRRIGDPLPSFKLGKARRYRLSDVMAWADRQATV
jgi:hypothetical protein